MPSGRPPQGGEKYEKPLEHAFNGFSYAIKVFSIDSRYMRIKALRINQTDLRQNNYRIPFPNSSDWSNDCFGFGIHDLNISRSLIREHLPVYFQTLPRRFGPGELAYFSPAVVSQILLK